MPTDRTYTPALGTRALTPFYDLAIAGLTRERHWRPALARQVSPEPRERILDVGCGTGTLTRALARACPEAAIVGIDPDPEVLARARAAAEKEGCKVTYIEGFLDLTFVENHGPFDKVVSSLVLHQVPLDGKRDILVRAHGALLPGGEIHIADYGLQPTPAMRFVFRNTVQRLDGVEDTGPNALGIVPELMREAGFAQVGETAVFATPTGSISLCRGVCTP